jgi:hypothetical protein
VQIDEHGETGGQQKYDGGWPTKASSGCELNSQQPKRQGRRTKPCEEYENAPRRMNDSACRERNSDEVEESIPTRNPHENGGSQMTIALNAVHGVFSGLTGIRPQNAVYYALDVTSQPACHARNIVLVIRESSAICPWIQNEIWSREKPQAWPGAPSGWSPIPRRACKRSFM